MPVTTITLAPANGFPQLVNGAAATPIRVVTIWSYRKCWICGQDGWCEHREPRVEMAFIEAFERKKRKQNA